MQQQHQEGFKLQKCNQDSSGGCVSLWNLAGTSQLLRLTDILEEAGSISRLTSSQYVRLHSSEQPFLQPDCMDAAALHSCCPW
jgi:hypothetical protein